MGEVMSQAKISKSRVLVVDDARANRKLLADLVRRDGHEAIVASGGAEALTLLASYEFDLVLLDLMMPVVDGMAVLAELQRRQMLPKLPVVVVTAHEDRKMRIDALTAGAVDYITKPIDGLEVTCRIRTLIGHKQLRESELQTVEGKLRESDHLHRLQVEQSPVATIAWAEDFQVASWNPAAEKLFGYTKAEAIGQHGSFIVPEHLRSKVDALWYDLVCGRSTEVTNESITKDGRTIVCEWHSAPISTADGRILGVSSKVLNVTQRNQLQNALVESQKMEALGQFAGGVAHDLNNIMAVIMSYGCLIRDSLSSGDPQREDIIEVLGAADRATALTRQLLTFSRRQHIKKVALELNERLGNLEKLLVRTLGERIALSIVPSSRPAVVQVDPVQFDQILLNLAVNSRDAMPKGGHLQIALMEIPGSKTNASDLGWIQLEVTDTGEGMDDQVLPNIFKSFFTTKEYGRGTGLGLAICLEVVNDAGGTMEVKSAKGLGTTFTIKLPLCGTDSMSQVVDPNEIEIRGHGEVVLVVEDDPSLRKVSARIFESAGYTVHVAADGLGAKRKIDELGAGLDLLVCDMVLPGFNVFEVSGHASQVAPGAAILLTSGFVDDAVKLARQADLPILWKPVSPNQLRWAAAEALEKAGCHTAPSSESLEIAPETAERTVLVVEDEDAVCRMIVRILSRAGYIVRTAGSLAEARNQLETEPEPYRVLCDLTLADGSGTVLLDWIEQTRPTLRPRVLVLTGGATDAEGVRVTTSGAFKVLSKPFQTKELLNALAEHCQ
jgi:two-component system cell cycle sensor histidine kinase/response regulator CckA